MELITLDKRKNIATLISADEIQQITLSLEKELARPEYNFTVTEITVKDAKGVMANLNKIKTMFEDFAKFKVDQESDDLNKFKGSFKEFGNMCQAKRDEIENSVKIFEDDARTKHKLTGMDYIVSKCDEFNIREEFQTFDFKLSISAFNADGTKLKKPFIDALDLIIDSALGKQAQEDLKIREAEIEREKEIQRRLEIERDKERISKENVIREERERAEREKQEALEQQRIELEQNSVPASSIDVPYQVTPTFARTDTSVPAVNAMPARTQEPAPVAKDGNSVYAVQINYKIEAKTGIPCDAIVNKIRKMMSDAGFHSDLDIDVCESSNV